jgi:hypothetical protein
MLRDGDFCSREHREQHQLRRGMSRVLEAGQVSQLERRKEKPQLIAVGPPSYEAEAVRRPCPDPPGLGRRAYDCFLPALNVAANLRPARADAVSPAAAGQAAAAATVERRAAAGAAAVRRALALRNYRPAARRPGPGVRMLAGPSAGAVKTSPAETAPVRRPMPASPSRPELTDPLFRPARLPEPADPGRRRMPAAQLLSRVPAAVPLGRPASARRGAGEVRFPSGHTRGRPPIPLSRRRIGAPARAPEPSFLAGRRPGAVFLPSGPRGFERRLRTDVALPAVSRRTERREVRLAGFGRPSGPAWAIGAAAPRTPANIRIPAADGFRHTAPALETVPVRGFGLVAERDAGMAAARPLLVPPRPWDRAPRRRAATVPHPAHPRIVPRFAGGIANRSKLGAAPPAIPPMAIRRADGAAAARLCEPKRGPGATGRDAASPSLRPRTVSPAGGSRNGFAPSRAFPVALRAATAPADRWAGAAPFVPQQPRNRDAPLGIRGAITGLPGETAAALEDNFGSGLGRWVGALENWRLDAAGVRIGSLALFAPSLGMRDYELEFLAKIERVSVNCLIRAADFQNYWAIRISLEQHAEGQILELERRAVVAGVPDAPVTISAPVAVRAKAAFRIQASAKGAEFTVSVEGRTIDRWSDNRLETGGVGFHSGQQDSARLYWVKLKRPAAGIRIH